MNPSDFASVELAQRAAVGDLDPEVVCWVQAAFSRYRAGDDLALAFGLDRASRIRQRNRALRSAAGLLDQDDGPWRCAQRLAAAIQRYEGRIRPLLTRDPHLKLPPLDEALRQAFNTGARVPSTTRNLFELIK